MPGKHPKKKQKQRPDQITQKIHGKIVIKHLYTNRFAEVDQVAPGSDQIIYVLTAVCTDNLSPLMVIFKFTSELRSLLKTATSHQHSDDEAVNRQPAKMDEIDLKR